MIGGEEGLTIVRNGWARFWKVSILWFGSIALFEQRLSTRPPLGTAGRGLGSLLVQGSAKPSVLQGVPSSL